MIDPHGAIGLDPCIWLAVLLPRPGALASAEVSGCRAIIASLDAERIRCVTSSLAVAETVYALGREGIVPDRRRQLLTYLTEGLRSRLTFMTLDVDVAIVAAEHRLKHYHRERAPISYADSIYVSTAERARASCLVTTDDALLGLGDARIIRPSELVGRLGLD